MDDLFENEPQLKQDEAQVLSSSVRPLADRMRPRTMDEFLGQQELVGPDSLLRRMIESDEVRSMIFWGPPGSGKTTLAFIIAGLTKAHFLSISAVTSGVADIKRVIAEAREIGRAKRIRTILFIDEIHRFNRIQQDALLPHVEAGVVTLIGATTENPSFSIIAPLLSRCRVFTLNELSEENLVEILKSAIAEPERGLGHLKVQVEDTALGLMARMSDGDARRALNLLEMVVYSAPLQSDGSYRIGLDEIKEVAQRKQLIYDASGEQHYNLISAFHKSLRGSDVQAAVYWLVRMLTAGEDPLFILRRMLNFASEDIGNADPRALQVAVAAMDAFKHMGLPEGEIPITQAVVYLATAPKSNASYMALQAARAEVNRSGSLPVPMVIRNAPTGLMKKLGYGEGYRYPHDYEDHFAPQQYLPDDIKDAKYYYPGEFGFERDIAKRMEWWDQRRKDLEGKEPARRDPTALVIEEKANAKNETNGNEKVEAKKPDVKPATGSKAIKKTDAKPKARTKKSGAQGSENKKKL